MSQHIKVDSKQKKNPNVILITTIIPVIILSGVVVASFDTNLWTIKEIDHFYLEMFSVVLSSTVAIYAIVRGYTFRDEFSLFIGLGFFVSAIIDLLHGVFSLLNIGDIIFEGFFIPQTWVAGRIMMGIVMAIAIIKFGKTGKKIKQKSLKKELIFYTTFLSGLACTVTVFSLIQPLPFITIDFLIKRPYEISAAILFVTAMIFFYKQKLHLIQDSFYKGVLLAIIIDVFVNVIISYSSNIFDTAFTVAHVLKNVSYFVFIATLSFSTIHHYKIKEKALQELTQSKKALNEASIIAITDEKGKMTYVNDKFTEVSKYSKDELIGQDHRILKSGYHTPEFYRDLWGKITFGKTWRGEIKNKAKDGSYYWVNTTIIPIIDENNLITGYTTVRTDITEQKEQQETLTKIETKKDEFVSMISHELKTPLSPIISWSGMLQEGVLGNLTEKQKYGVLKIQENSNELLELIQDILDVHKLELGKMNFKMSKFNIKHLLSGIIEDYKIKYLQKYSFSLQCDDIEMYSDERRIIQIIRNFVNNALDFLPEDNPKIDLSAKNEDDYIVISVKDNGCGISKENQKNLFKKFYQVDTSATRDHGGTGLGLCICTGIAEGLNGKIGVNSDKGHGAEFFIKIPRNQAIQITN